LSLAIVKKKKSVIVLAWLAPIIAILISSNMLYEHYKKLGNTITITFDDVSGLDLRKSHIQYKGVFIGDIKSITLDKDNFNQYIVKAQIYSQYEYLVTKGSKFFLVSPKISMTKIEAIGNILTGNYIELIPASSDKKVLDTLDKQSFFEGLSNSPLQSGMKLSLISNIGDLGIGGEILFKGIKIGEIIDKSLLNKKVVYGINIFDKYRYLISEDTKFYKLNPLNIKANLQELNIDISPIKNMLQGAIEIVSSNSKTKPKKEYILQDNRFDSSDSYFQFNIISDNLSKDEYIFYKGVKIGFVSEVKLQTTNNIAIVKIESKYKYLINNSTKFYKIKAIDSKISDEKIDIKIAPLKEFAFGGISFITPKKSVFTKKSFILYDNKDSIIDVKKEYFDLIILGNNIALGEKIFYKGIKIGFVKDVILQKSQNILKVKIESKYKYLISGSTKFYKLSAIKSKVSIDDGFSMDIGSLKELAFGGITFITSEDSSKIKDKYILYNSLDDIKNIDKFNITILMDKNSGIKVGSKLLYKNIHIGSVKSLELNNQIEAKVSIDKKYKYLFGKDSKIYIQGATISLKGIKNIDTMVFGYNLYLIDDKIGSFKSRFYLDSINPSSTKYQDGIRLNIFTKNAKDLNIESPIFYKGITIGSIENIQLYNDNKKVTLTLFIEQKYSSLIKKDSKFKRVDNIDIDLSLVNAKIKVGTIDSLLKGGIELINYNPKLPNSQRIDQKFID
jgi:paraquat-inducible protein B